MPKVAETHKVSPINKLKIKLKLEPKLNPNLKLELECDLLIEPSIEPSGNIHLDIRHALFLGFLPLRFDKSGDNVVIRIH